MTGDFFRAKRPWSKYKDFILGYYLEPYIPKVARLQKPIIIVDCFAGRGKFDDGEPGSPLIIAPLVKKWHDEKGIRISAEFIEADQDNYDELVKSLEAYRDIATPRFGNFQDHLADLAAKAKQNTVFLYVDPYTVKGLIFERMKAVYDQIRIASASVEVLLNFNVGTFMRWGLAALTRIDDLPAEATDSEADYQADDPTERVEMDTLDSIAGGRYWRDIANNEQSSFVEKLDLFTTEYRRRMCSSFQFAASCEIKSKYEHQVPKYVLIYATRHEDGIELMNDGMCKARRDFLGARFVKGRLFDVTPEEEQPDIGELANLLHAILKDKGVLTRKRLHALAIASSFGRYQSKDMNAGTKRLLDTGKIFSETGKNRINDKVRLSCTPFRNN